MAGQPTAVQLGPGRGVRWRRWLGLSVPALIALALLVAQVLGQSCAEDRACQSGLYGLIGGMTLTQGVNLIVIFALCGHLRRRKNKRGA